MKLDLNYLLELSIKAACKASEEILKIYKDVNFDVEKKQDGTPITLADKNANNVIENILSKTNIPVLSEEGKDITYKERQSWDYFWLVDPLDGTKEFVKKNGEFTVNIALIKNGHPLLGVIHVPVSNVLYFSSVNLGSFKSHDIDFQNFKIYDLINLSKKLPLIEERECYTVVSSRSHVTKETELFFEKQRQKFGDIKIIPVGSSLKICLVAEGTADAYPRYGPTMEWDIAAGHAIAKYAGKKVIKIVDSELKDSLSYNKKNLTNPWFIVH